jgi:chromosome segregation ATPase
MLTAGEIEGEQTESGRWRLPRREVHRLLSARRERADLSGEPPASRSARQRNVEASESVRELMERVEALSRELGRSEARLELTERAESSIRGERDRLASELEAERDERRRLQEQLAAGASRESRERPAEPTAEPPSRPPSIAAALSRLLRRISGGSGGG